MTFIDYLAMIRRRWLPGFIITALVALSSVILVQWKNTKPFSSTVFVSIGTVQEPNLQNNPTNIFENVQASDQFSQTVQGWFKNPQFLDQLSQKTGIISDISASNQQKQNVVVTFDAATQDQANMLSQTVKDELNNEIQTYDNKTGTKFQAAILEANIQKKPLSLILFLLVGILGGLIVASFALYGYEYFLRKISSPELASEILRKKPVERLPGFDNQHQKLQFFSAYLSKTEGKNIQYISTESQVHKLTKSMENLVPNKTLSSVHFPDESLKISAHDHHVIVCALGKTSIEDLRKIETLISPSFDLIIVEA